MIKINLLGDEPEAPVNSILLLVAYGFSIATVLLIWVIAQWYVSSSIQEVKSRTHLLNIQIATLKEKTQEVDGLKKIKDELENITLAIAVLRRAQQGPVRLLDSIDSSTPPKIWITGIESKVDKMKLSALALEDTDIATFIQNLRKSSLIPEAELTDRRAVPLMQINTFNSFSGEQTKRVVRGEKSDLTAVFAEIKKEAESAGLNYSTGVPDSSLKDSVATIGNPAEGAVTKLSFSDIKTRKRAGGGRPTIYAWESLEKVKGIGFVADLKIRYDDSGVDIESLNNALSAASNTDKEEKKKPSKSE